MHSERVQRHCKGISQALADLKTRFNDMTSQHNDLADKFHEDIEALEIVFVNATKSSKFVLKYLFDLVMRIFETSSQIAKVINKREHYKNYLSHMMMFNFCFRLVSLTNQLSVEQDKYMTVIRTSLRRFRQDLDDTLQMLRESNAQFIKSFKYVWKSKSP